MLLTIIIFVSSILLSGFLAVKTYRILRKKKLANWARSNKKEARWLLVFFNLLMIVLGISIGLLCVKLDLKLNENVGYVALGIFVLLTYVFPSKSKVFGELAGRYEKKQKMTVLRVAASIVALIVFTSSWGQGVVDGNSLHAGIGPAGLIVLATLGLFVLGAAVLVLSCGIACNGYEGAALVVLICGWGGLITLYVLTIRKINRNHRQKGLKPSQRTNLDPDLLDDGVID